MKDKIYYFAYGSNIPSKYIKQHCPSAEFVGVGFLNDYELNYNYYADINAKKGEKVLGVVYCIDKRELARLDYYEGYPNLYKRYNVEIDVSGVSFDCLVYEMTRRNKKAELPTLDYLDIIDEGYNEYNMNKEYYLNPLKEMLKR